nr:immunoglobulin heavy chain junction region [Mus musculus]
CAREGNWGPFDYW